MSSPVTENPAAEPPLAIRHFSELFAFETDCWDVHAALQTGEPDFILIDTRSEQLFAAGHIPGAMSLPHRKIIESRMARFPQGTLFVAYCAGPHCNGAARACLKLAQLGFRCKLMAGGVTGWLDEGFALATQEAGAA